MVNIGYGGYQWLYMVISGYACIAWLTVVNGSSDGY